MITATTTRMLFLMLDGSSLHTGRHDYIEVPSHTATALSQIFPPSATAWDAESCAAIAESLMPDDALITYLDLGAEEIMSLKAEEDMLFAMRERVSYVIIHGAYDHDARTTAMNILHCSPEPAGAIMHLLSRDFILSFIDGSTQRGNDVVYKAWSTALQLMAGFTTAVRPDELSIYLPLACSTMYDEITWIGSDPHERPIGAQSFRTYSLTGPDKEV